MAVITILEWRPKHWLTRRWCACVTSGCPGRWACPSNLVLASRQQLAEQHLVDATAGVGFGGARHLAEIDPCAEVPAVAGVGCDASDVEVVVEDGLDVRFCGGAVEG